MSDGSKIAKNAAWLLVATTMNKVIAFATFAIVAALTGPEITGVYFFGVSVTSVFVILSDLGMTPVLIRAIAGSRDDGSRMLGAALRAKCILAPIAICASIVYGIMRGSDPATMGTIAIACLVMTADTFHLALYGALRGKQNLKPEAIGMLIGQLLTACTAVTVALLQLGPMGLAFALLVGSTWNVGWAFVQARRFGIRIDRPTARDVRSLVTESIPFAIAGASVKLYSYVDSLLIEAYHGVKEVGYYAVSYKMTYALQFIPLTFTAALYPALAAAWARKDHDELQRSFLGSLRVMAAIGFPLSAGLSALAPRIIPLVYSDAYLPSIPSFEILPWVLLPIFLDFPVGALLNATHRAHLKTTAMVGTMVINVVMNALLVPTYSTVGAAWAGIVSFWMLFCIGMYFTRKDAGGVWVLCSILLRASAASVLAWVAWREIGQQFALPIACIIGAVVAVVSAFVFQLLTPNDVKWIFRMRKPSIDEENVHENT